MATPPIYLLDTNILILLIRDTVAGKGVAAHFGLRPAATAKVCGVPLLTTDTDFDHLHPTEITRIRIDDKTGLPLP